MPTLAKSLSDHSILGRHVWLLVPGYIAVTVAVFVIFGFGFEWSSLAKPMIPAVAAAIIYVIYSHFRPDQMICAMSESLLFLFLVAPPLAVMDYPLQSLNLPFYDAQLAAIDRAMGFDWLSHFSWVGSHPIFADVLAMAYHSCMIQLAAVTIVLSLTKNFEHLREFLCLFTVTAMTVGVISTIVPVEGAIIFHAPADALRFGSDPLVGAWHLEHLRALRDGTMTTVSLAHAEGLVTMPSFHVIFAILLAWATRGNRYIFVPSLMLNGLVFVSALSIGGHYLIDLIAGAAIACAAIYGYSKRTALAAALARAVSWLSPPLLGTAGTAAQR